jgi:hypothetical protein
MTNSEPTYPSTEGTHVLYKEEGNTVRLLPHDGSGEYHVRICEYLGNGECGTYSDTIIVNLVETDQPTDSSVTSIVLSADDDLN